MSMCVCAADAGFYESVDLELCYAPPYGSASDPVNFAVGQQFHERILKVHRVNHL